MDTITDVEKPVKEQRRAYHVRLRPSVYAAVREAAQDQESNIGKVMEACILKALPLDDRP